jgi:hypothetical protein
MELEVFSYSQATAAHSPSCQVLETFRELCSGRASLLDTGANGIQQHRVEPSRSSPLAPQAKFVEGMGL